MLVECLFPVAGSLFYFRVKSLALLTLYLRMKSLFFNLHDVMKTLGRAKIPFSDDHCLHHIMKVEK